ncbi:CHAT domain-containing protein [Geodermatophilus chilensis]|uniref:CHAT domain-containing protein n=1 Tax=Geodermatophilus chilensis TaxID=2035835 RepID=UPI000C26B80F|nr:CHAT domain-containing tetratricopeptide repeat protein [Geodermatophilus chilensis]
MATRTGLPTGTGVHEEVGSASLHQAEEALRLAEADPGRAVAVAAEAVRAARSARDLHAVSVAERALGIAALHQEDLDAAMRHLRAAIASGRRAGAAGLVAEARIRYAFAVSVRGRPDQALRELDDVLTSAVPGHQRARATAQRGAVLHQLGRLDEALGCYQRAVPGLRRAGDRLWLQRVLFNRGVLHGYRHAFAAAEADLREAERLCRALGLELSLGFVHQNLGWVRSLQGDVPAALAHLDEAERRFRSTGAGLGELLTDRSQLLLTASLVSEAREAARQAVELFAGDRRGLLLPEVRLLLAQAASRDGHPELAAEQARRAVREFTRQQRPEWAVLARFVRVTSADGTSRTGVRQLVALADELSAAGWPAASLDARLMAGRGALERRQHGEARRQLELAGRRRRRGPALLRARAWYAQALLRHADGDRRGARVAVRTGLTVLDEYRAALGATDLRARAAAHRTDLAELGLTMALEDGRPDVVLAWEEERRASHLLLPSVRPPDDPALAQALGELRLTAGEIDQARGAGPVPAHLLRRQLELERAIRDHCRRLGGGPAGPARSAPALGSLPSALGDAALVEFFTRRSALHAVSQVDGRTRVHDLGGLGEVEELLDRVPFALHRLARQRGDGPSCAAALSLLRHTAEQLDARILGPLGAVLADRPLVVVPTGPLQSLPWQVLPSCRQRPVTVAPSAALWLEAHRRTGTGTATVVAAGPGLPGARAEAETVARLHGSPALVGPAATAGAVARSLHGARLAHLAAHGRVHPHNPLFSSIGLADGPLTVYDLERLGQGPGTVVLSACNSGRSVVCAGDELLGLTAAFLSLGTRQVVASVIPVPDAETAPLMTAFHELLAAGRSVAAALAEAQARTSATEPAVVAAAAGFVCVGADAPLTPVADGGPAAGPAVGTAPALTPARPGPRR